MIELVLAIFPGAKIVSKKRVRTWWFSTEKMTVVAECEDDVIVQCSPIIFKFKGGHIKQLADWLRLQPGFQFEEICKKDNSDE